jgi:hypothetical protein
MPIQGLICRRLYAPQLAHTTAPGLTTDRQKPHSSPMSRSQLADAELSGITSLEWGSPDTFRRGQAVY